jgi:condensin complex subunit 3
VFTSFLNRPTRQIKIPHHVFAQNRHTVASSSISNKMPGRVSTRSARPSASSHLSRKSSVPTLNSRASTASRLSTPTTDVPNDGPESELRTLICAIFGDSQRTTAGHRKLVIRLRKIQEQCCYEPPRGPKNRSEEVEQFEEDGFNSEVGRCIIRVLGVKKAEAAGDRVLWFLGLFLKHASDIGIYYAPCKLMGN